MGLIDHLKNRKKTYLGSAIILALVVLVDFVVFNFDHTPMGEHEEEAKVQMSRIVDLVLKQENLNLNLVEIGYRPEGTLKNVYGFLSSCHPQFRNLNLVEVYDLSNPVATFKFDRSLIPYKDEIKNFFQGSACLNSDVRVYAVFRTRGGLVAGWFMNLNHVMGTLKPL